MRARVLRSRTVPGMVALACAFGGAPAARAHEWWLEPAHFAASAPETVTVAAFAGMGFHGERKAFATARVARMALSADGTTRELPSSGIPGTDVFARVPAADLGRGPAVVALETHFAQLTLAAAEFDEYLRAEGLDGPLAARRGAPRDSVRERYARCARIWLRGGERAAGSTGLTFELLPRSDPTRESAGAARRPLEVQVLLRGRPLPGALVRAWRRPLDHADVPAPADARDSVAVFASARSDARGIARVPVHGAGEWLLAAVHMERSDDPAAADWQSFWASLTFARR